MVGGVRQHSPATVALGAADDRLPPEFPNFAAAENLLHTDRVDLIYQDRSTSSRRVPSTVALNHHIYVYTLHLYNIFFIFIVYNNLIPSRIIKLK